jgi:hypothetical protein
MKGLDHLAFGGWERVAGFEATEVAGAGNDDGFDGIADAEIGRAWFGG